MKLHIRIACIIVYIHCMIFATIATDCEYFGHDFSKLRFSGHDGNIPWTVVNKTGDELIRYDLSICSALSNSDTEDACKEHTSVCRRSQQASGSQAVVAIGNYLDTLNITEDTDKKEYWLHLKGAPCPQDANSFQKTVINFKCAKTLGYPVLVESYGCETYFEWYTSVVCRDTAAAQQEVACAVYDNKGLKYDLTPLLKLKGGHLVETSDTKEFYINVCRDITPDGSTSACSVGSGACLVTSGGAAVSMGSPTSPVKWTPAGKTTSLGGKLSLTYSTDSPPDGCTGNAVTEINFVCPKRGRGHAPILISDMDCHYAVEWQTESACPEDQLVSNNCTLSQDQHGIDIDLSPLKKHPDASTPYFVEYKKSDSQTYLYYMNICGSLNRNCPTAEATGSDMAACQLQKEDSGFGRVMGRTGHQTLRYSDGELTLTYQDGQTCHTYFQRETVINFHCNKTAVNDGAGVPVYNSESDCTYIFDWGTKYACIEQPSLECMVTHGDHHFDLSSLIRTVAASNWEALTSGDEETQDTRYFLNVCGAVTSTGDASTCPQGAAVCLYEKNSSERKDLGHYLESPTYDEENQAIKLHYTQGSSCGSSKQRETFITLRCRPGDMESAPSLVRKSQDECIYEFEWHTAAACTLGQQIGDNCQVFDQTAGFSYDLSPLKSETFYKVSPTSEGQDYYINVCGPVKGSPCDSDKEVGVCQAEHSNTDHNHITGLVTSKLYYYDGFINMTFTGGDDYQTVPPIPRKSEIAFVCDPSAGNGGKGEPEYLMESKHTYSFLWRTAYACPRKPTECVVTDSNGKQYDLSSLAEPEDNWSALDESGDERHKFYLGVCRSLKPIAVGTGCSPYAGACATQFTDGKESVMLHNLGEVESPPTVEGSGQVLLEYKNGDECTAADGTKTHYATKIHLRCLPGLHVSGPTFLAKSDCTYTFIWETDAACPISDARSEGNDSCTVKDVNSGYTFNLKPLKTEEAYTVAPHDDGDKTFSINICGTTSQCSSQSGHKVAVCDQDKLNLGEVNQKLEYSDNGELTLKYSNGELIIESGERMSTLVTFICNRDKPLGSPVFSRKDGATYIFNVETSLACPPQTVDCTVTDPMGQSYDLTPLAKTEGNWEVPDSRTEHKDLKYYLNLCRPINPAPGTSCPGGPIGGCQVDGKGTAHNLGYIQSKPVAVEGMLSIRYMGGDVCHKGTPQESTRSTRINLICSTTEGAAPVFVGETPECEYVFSWQTPAACTQTRVEGDKCMVDDPIFHSHFDLSSLHRGGSSDYEVKVGQDTYAINICGALNTGEKDCEGSKNVGACLTTAGKQPADIGHFSQKLTYDYGALTLTYDLGSKCTNDQNSDLQQKTKFSFVCDHRNYGTNGPKFVEKTSDCIYQFEWPTSLACLPFKVVDCSIQNSQGDEFELSPLTLTDDNYVAEVPHLNKKFILNVCTTVVHKPGMVCPPNSVACLIDNNEKDINKKSQKIGDLISDVLSFDRSGHLVLTYNTEEKCSVEGQTRKTIITFICKKDAVGTKPEFLYVENVDCTYSFSWESSAACAKQTVDIGGNTDMQQCTAKNPSTGYGFDMSVLSKAEGYLVEDKNSHSYRINVCAGLHSDSQHSCGTKSGVCQFDPVNQKSHNCGNFSSQLIYKDEMLYLNYTGGEVCRHSNTPRNTLIYFVCGPPGSGQGEPYFVAESDDCTYHIIWRTELACEEQKKWSCTVEDDKGNVLDLSALIKAEGHHFALNSLGKDSGTYYINVCRPVNPIDQRLCPPMSAACRVSEDGTTMGLGRVSGNMKYEKETGRVVMIYDHGEKCNSQPQKNISSKIIFICEPGPSQGQPSLVEVSDDCQYVFEWATNAVCPQNVDITTQECRFKDPQTETEFDLASLTKLATESSYKVESPVANQGTYYINMCGSVTDREAIAAGCGSAAVCLVTGTSGYQFASGSKEEIIKEGRGFKVAYTDGGTTCSTSASGKSAAYFIMVCNRDIKGQGAPVYFSRSACDVVFEWETALACPPQVEQCLLSHQGAEYDLSDLSRSDDSLSITDANGNKYWLNLCQEVHGGPAGCPSGAAICRQTTDGTVDVLGTVATQKITMDNSAGDAHSITVKYSGGTPADCGQGLAATTLIHLHCDKANRLPYLLPRKGDTGSCVYEFNWHTRIACKDQKSKVTIKDGQIVDPKTESSISLANLTANTILGRGFENNVEYTYMFGFPEQLSTPGCEGAGVCRTQPGVNHATQVLGQFSTMELYMEDDVLEVVYTSETSCPTQPAIKVATILMIHCVESTGIQPLSQDQPQLTDKTSDCKYLFDWYTPKACPTNLIFAVPQDNSGGTLSGGGGSARGGTVGVVITILLTVLILALLAVVFHKPERRAMCRSSMRRLLRKTYVGRSISYSKLSSDAEDAEGNSLLSGFVSSGTESRAPIPAFHDDSDEDLIL